MTSPPHAAGKPLGAVFLFAVCSLVVSLPTEGPGPAERVWVYAETLASIGCWGRIACESVVAPIWCGVSDFLFSEREKDEWFLSQENAIIHE
jgi:hypothetical protein